MNRGIPTDEEVRAAWERVTFAGAPLAGYDFEDGQAVYVRGVAAHTDRPEPGQKWAAWCVFGFCALVVVAYAWQAFTAH